MFCRRDIRRHPPFSTAQPSEVRPHFLKIKTFDRKVQNQIACISQTSRVNTIVVPSSWCLASVTEATKNKLTLGVVLARYS